MIVYALQRTPTELLDDCTPGNLHLLIATCF